MALDERGREVPDPRPVEWPADLRRPLTIQEEIQRFVRVELSKVAAEDGMETFEESDDFVVDDEEEYVSPYEMTEMQEERAFSPAERSSESSEADGSKQDKQTDDKSGSVLSTGVDDAAVQQKAPAGGPT